ncbi:STAS domain-containing protein [Streptomyces sp. NPDC049040]|uniref:STAS domain-containing protein n=1 Tax=Streptomyces sp. NPDC049040 TaxID=3365593 RepID=UPI00371B6B6D
MPVLTSFHLSRRDCGHRTTITLAGEIDLAAAPALRAAVEDCLRKGIRTITIDLAALDFCDVSGLNAFLAAAERTASENGSLRLLHPRPQMAQLLRLSGTGFLLRATHLTLARPIASDPVPAAHPGVPAP